MKGRWGWILGLFLVLSVAFAYWRGVPLLTLKTQNPISQELPKPKAAPVEWKTYSKAQTDILETPTTQKEKDLLQSKFPQGPAGTPLPETGPEVVLNGRILLGDPADIDRAQKGNLAFLNQYNQSWQRSFSQKILKFFPKETKTFIRPQQSYLKVNALGGRFIERAQVSIMLPNGNLSNYSALIDSATGETLHTWDQTHFEQTHEREKFSPSGEL